MKSEDELILKALDRDVCGGQQATGVDNQELKALRSIAARLTAMGDVAPPPGFTQRVMAALPAQRRSLWAGLKELLVRPHVIKLNLAWETGAAVLLLALALTGYGWPPGLGQRQAAATAPPLIHTRFTVKAPGARSVSLAGDFNNWCQEDCRLIKAEADGVWTVTVPLQPGRYKYMFFVDGHRWQTDPQAESYEQDGFGHRNAVVDVDGPEKASV